MTTIRKLKNETEAPTIVSTNDESKPTLSNEIKDLLSNKAFCKNTFKEDLAEDNKKIEERRLHPINFDGIIGHEDLKQAILYKVKAKLVTSERSKLYRESIKYHATSGILIYGLPGVGKSDVLRQIAESVRDHPDIDCKEMSCSDFQGNVGTNAKMIDDVFDAARSTRKKCCIMLIDEIDSVMMKKKGHLNVAERTNAMQSNMDGMQDSSKLIIIATTNRINGMEEASISRFTRINLELPTSDERKEFIKRYILAIPMEKEPNIDVIVKYTEGFSGRMFRDLGLKLDDIEVVDNKPISYSVLIREISKYMTQAGRNQKRMQEDEEGNSLKQENASIITTVDNNTTNKRPFLTLDSDGMEQSRLAVV